MKTLLPSAYFPPISYFAYLVQGDVVIEVKEHFVKQTIRNRCRILGVNGPLNLLVPRTKPTGRQAFDHDITHEEADWRKLHWRSLDSAYRNSPYFEYYEDGMRPFFETDERNLLRLNLGSVATVCRILGVPFDSELTDEYAAEPTGADLRNAWNKIPYRTRNPIREYPEYIQVFSDRHAFVPDLSILDLMFCLGPRSVDYLNGLELNRTPA